MSDFLQGTVARVTVHIKPDHEGEVMANILGGPQAFPAQTYDGETEFKVGDRVFVAERSGRVLYVVAMA